MRVSVVNEEDGSVLSIDVGAETAVQDVLAMFAPGLRLWHEERPLAAAASLAAVGDGALVVLRRDADPRAAQIEDARQMLLNDPQMLARLAQSNPSLAAAAADDPARFAVLMEDARRAVVRSAGSPGDELSPDAQRRIEDAIRRQAIAENIAQALDEHPETFGAVHMLYVRALVNGAAISAFVDCGAQATIMPLAAARRCGIARLLDERFAGVAQGVGQSRILGRVHSVQLSLLGGTGAGLHLLVSVTVIEDGDAGARTPDLLLGLDMLRRYRAVVDLARDALVVSDSVVPFLSQAEAPHSDGGRADTGNE